MKIYQILPSQLYVSANTNRASGGLRSEITEGYGVTMTISLWRGWDDPVLASATTAFLMPIADGKEIPERTLETLVRLASGEIRRGGRVLVQCHAGRNRAGLLAALIVRELHGCPGA